MPTKLEDRLTELGKTDAQIGILSSLWVLHQKLLTMVLAATSPLFASYTDHGPMHSLEIINCVERILGTKRIAKLSPTDTWLILECSFRHDTGMYVTDEEINNLVASDTYKNRLLSLSDTGDTDLAMAARNLLNISPHTNMSDVSANSIETLGLAKRIHLVLQDYYRNRHAQRSADNILSDHANTESHNADSLIQPRLWKHMATICAGHTKSHKEIMKLPQYEKGFCNDVAHPRFVAFLLRLGDLMCMDNDRVNPHLLKLWGKEVPDMSEAHILKHTALEHLYISPEKIEAKVRLNLPNYAPAVPEGAYYSKERAEYHYKRKELANDFEKKRVSNEYLIRDEANALTAFLVKKNWNEMDMLVEETIRDQRHHNNAEHIARTAYETGKWFSRIDDELKFIAMHWLEIAPKDMPGSVPRFTQRDILFNDHHFNNAIINLAYRISHSRATSIITGSSLYRVGAERENPRLYPSYNHELVFIREFVQNAMDSTKMQMFRYLRQSRYDNPTEFYYNDSPFKYANSFCDWNPEKVFTRLGSTVWDMRVEVRVLYYTIQRNHRLVFVFQDAGTGIDEETLQYMSHIGETRSQALINEINEMPEWLQPNGSFGIGMQSAFGVVNKFRASSWSKKDFRGRTIYFHNDPDGGRLFAVERDNNDINTNFGTKFVIALTDEDIEKTSIFHNKGYHAFKRDIGMLLYELKSQFNKMLQQDLFPIRIRFFIDDVELKTCKLDFNPLFPILKRRYWENDCADQ